MKAFNIPMDAKFHMSLKKHCIDTDIFMKQFILDAIIEKIASDKNKKM